MHRLFVLFGSLAVAILMIGVAFGSTSPAAEAADCQSGQYWRTPTGNVGFNAGVGQIVTSVCIRMSDTVNTGQIGNGLTANGCYSVSGVGTSLASVTRVNNPTVCQGASIYAVYGPTLASTTPPTILPIAPPRNAVRGQRTGERHDRERPHSGTRR